MPRSTNSVRAASRIRVRSFSRSSGDLDLGGIVNTQRVNGVKLTALSLKVKILLSLAGRLNRCCLKTARQATIGIYTGF